VAPPRDPLAALRNLGPASARLLRAAGIATPDELRDLGAVLAYRLVAHRHGGASVNLLYALHGALEDRHWASLTTDERDALRAAADLPPARKA
jgi:DNA transformation protein and related proteins